MSKYKLKIIINNFNCNTSSFYEYAPFIINNNNIILSSNFYNSEKWFYDELIKKGYNVLIDDDNGYNVSIKDNKWWEIYELYISYFFYDYYSHVLNYDYTIIKLSDLQKKYIKNNILDNPEMDKSHNPEMDKSHNPEMDKSHNPEMDKSHNPEMDKSHNPEINKLHNPEINKLHNPEINKLYNDIELTLIKYNKCFIKTTGFVPNKVNNIISFDMNNKGSDIIKYLFEDPNDRCIKFIDYTKGVMIQSWNDEISLDRELRIFIKNKSIVAISQQDCSKQYIFFSFIKDYYIDICDNCDKLWMSIKDKLFYTNCILDVYIDDNFDVHLIEINPTHSWTGAKSALFEWILDPPDNYEFRIL